MSLPEVRAEVSIAHVMTTISNEADDNTRTNNWRIILKFMHRKRSTEKLVGSGSGRTRYSAVSQFKTEVVFTDWCLRKVFRFVYIPPAISPNPKYEEEPDEDH